MLRSRPNRRRHFGHAEAVDDVDEIHRDLAGEGRLCAAPRAGAQIVDGDIVEMRYHGLGKAWPGPAARERHRLRRDYDLSL